MKFPWNPNTSVQSVLDRLFQRVLFLLTPVFWEYLNPQVRINNVANSVD